MAVVLLAKLTAILPGHPDRVPPFLGKTCVVDDPGLDWPAALDRRQHQLCHPRFREGRLLPSIAASDHAALATKCSNDWCLAETRAGAVTAAIGSTLLRSPGINNPKQ